MDKNAAQSAATRPGEGEPDAGVLLRAAPFQERWEQARRRRELVLAARRAASEEPEFIGPTKPWDRTVRPQPDSRKVATPPNVAPSILPDRPADRDGAQLTPDEAGAAARRFAIPGGRLALGFALGLGFGVAVAWLAPLLQDDVVPADPGSGRMLSVADNGPAMPATAATDDGLPDQPAPISAYRPAPASPAPAAAPPEALPGSLTEKLAPAPLVAAAAPSPGGLETAVLDWHPTATAPDPRPDKTAPAPHRELASADQPPAPDLSPPPGPSPVAADPLAQARSAISIHLLAPGNAPAQALGDMADRLTATGFTVSDQDQVSVKVRQTHIRYYHAADADAAIALAATIGAEARDFTGFQPPPPPGLVEVWIAGVGSADTAPAPAPKPAKKKKAKPAVKAPAPGPTPAEQAEIDALAGRVLQLLRGQGG